MAARDHSGRYLATEIARLSLVSVRSQPARSALAVVGVVIGIVTVVLVASVLGSAISLRRVTRVDPASAIGTAS